MKNPPQDHTQVEFALGSAKREFGEHLNGALLFGSRATPRLAITSDIDILFLLSGADWSEIVEATVQLLNDHIEKFDSSSRWTHAPLLIVDGVPAFGPTFALGILERSRLLMGDINEIRPPLEKQVALPPSQSSMEPLRLFSIWELQRVVKEIFDAYVEFSANTAGDHRPEHKIARRLAKCCIYGSRILAFMDFGIWCLDDYSELAKKSGVNSLVEVVQRPERIPTIETLDRILNTFFERVVATY